MYADEIGLTNSETFLAASQRVKNEFFDTLKTAMRFRIAVLLYNSGGRFMKEIKIQGELSQR